MSASKLNRHWTREQISFLSDMIAAAVLVKTDRFEEGTISGGADLPPVRGVERTFVVSQIFKGEAPPDGKVVVRHYDSAAEIGPVASADCNDDERSNYFLYLKHFNDKFVPTSGMEEPSVSVCPFRGGHREKV
jgi:hypothetical protein